MVMSYDKSECLYLDWGLTSTKRLISSGFEFPCSLRGPLSQTRRRYLLLLIIWEAEGLLRIFRV